MHIKEFSSRLPLGNIGDSKIFLHQLTDSELYIITIQDIESPDIAISGIKNKEYDFASENGIIPNKLIVIDSITKKQLAEFGKMLSIRFPTINCYE